MKVYDMHVHIYDRNVNADDFVEKLDKAGVYGASTFSLAPEFGNVLDRLDHVIKFSGKYYYDRIFPVLWVHPFEKDAIKAVKRANDMGICAFKMICDNYDVYDKKSLKLIDEIKKTGKPIIFHSGILWKGKNTSIHNRPVNWECMNEVGDVKFSMGHVSWPWVDECIALYGKILNTYTKYPNDPMAEMFFDVTPGTPKIYRKEMWYKLFNVGYDVKNNIIFGSDCRAETYKTTWVKDWLITDNRILDELEISNEIREQVFSKNFLRFMGIDKTETKHISPTSDEVQNEGKK